MALVLAGMAIGAVTTTALLLGWAFLWPGAPTTLPRRELRAVVVDVLDNQPWSDDGDTRVWHPHSRHAYSAECAVCQGDTARLADAVADAVGHHLALVERENQTNG